MKDDVTASQPGCSPIGQEADVGKKVCSGPGGYWRDVYVVDGWSVSWIDCPSCHSSLHREAISEPPCGAAVTPHPVAPNTQEEGSP